MSRPREFDPDEVVDRAVEVFWRTGYAGTSVDELLAALGIARASLYRTFGSKEELYQRALARYRERHGQQFLACLSSEDASPLGGLRAVFDLVVAQSADPGRPRGCFVVTATSERVPADAATAAQVHEQFVALEAAFTDAAARAVDAGELPAGTDARQVGRYLVSSLQGLRVLATARPEADLLQDVVDATFAGLGAAQPRSRVATSSTSLAGTPAPVR